MEALVGVAEHVFKVACEDALTVRASTIDDLYLVM
jgi:hypothetical protein